LRDCLKYLSEAPVGLSHTSVGLSEAPLVVLLHGCNDSNCLGQRLQAFVNRHT
jgi:poly(3-hydroxybutyrate) depolymerase